MPSVFTVKEWKRQPLVRTNLAGALAPLLQSGIEAIPSIPGYSYELWLRRELAEEVAKAWWPDPGYCGKHGTRRERWGMIARPYCCEKCLREAEERQMELRRFWKAKARLYYLRGVAVEDLHLGPPTGRIRNERGRVRG